MAVAVAAAASAAGTALTAGALHASWLAAKTSSLPSLSEAARRTRLRPGKPAIAIGPSRGPTVPQ
eukprot:13429779-Alexandrium_andersonii.AAC.1